MRTPYGLPIIENCGSCPVMVKDGFCDLPEQSRDSWSHFRQSATHPRGAVLFVQGQAAAGMHLICTGQVKLRSTSPDGAAVIHGIFNSGDVLGAAETLLGSRYEATAETLTPSVVSYVKRDTLISLIRNDPEISLRLTSQLCAQLTAAHRQAGNRAVSRPALGRVSRFLFDFCNGRPSVSITLTREEIGEIVGLARETVTRCLGELANRNVIRVSGHRIAVLDPPALAQFGGS